MTGVQTCALPICQRLYEISLAIATERKADVIGAALVAGASQLMHAQAAVLFLTAVDPTRVAAVVTNGVELSHAPLPQPLAAFGLLAAAAAGQAVRVEDAPRDPAWAQTPGHRPPAQRLLSVPLLHREDLRGVLTVVNKDGAAPFSDSDVALLSTLAVHAAAAIGNAHFLEEIEIQAITDGLTGLYNHREFQKRLAEEVERARRYHKEFSLLMLDIDHFKALNDTHGHPVGDAVLQEIVQVIRRCVRNVDLPARYGGEEFAVILPETGGAPA